MNATGSSRIAIVDFGLGNMRSLAKALERLEHPGFITSDIDEIASAEKLVLPGDGAFGAAMTNLNRPDEKGRTLGGAVRDAIDAGKPLLGICVGMQVLLDWGEEFGRCDGLGIVGGSVLRFPDAPGIKIPQIGWNNLDFVQKDCPLFAGLESGAMVYFIHSFYCAPSDLSVVAASTRHGIEYCSVLHQENLYATQFHPEKSGAAGLKLLENFLKL